MVPAILPDFATIQLREISSVVVMPREESARKGNFSIRVGQYTRFGASVPRIKVEIKN